MNRNLISTFALALAVVMSGCTEALPTTTDVEASEGLEALFSGKARTAVEGGLNSHFGTTNPEAFSKGAQFIVPFSTGLTWGIGVFTPGSPPTLESAGFGAELDQGDFYRENNDGTVSVHVA